MPASATQQAYSREDVRRQLGVSKRQLESWEKQKLLSSSDSFSFSDILALRTLVGLRKSNVSAVQIRKPSTQCGSISANSRILSPK